MTTELLLEGLDFGEAPRWHEGRQGDAVTAHVETRTTLLRLRAGGRGWAHAVLHDRADVPPGEVVGRGRGTVEVAQV